MSKRKYEDVKGYWLYSIKVPSVNKYYIGVSKQQCSQRWKKAKYKDCSLEPYLQEWDSMIKTVLVDNLTKEEALKYEDALIQSLQMNNLCINRQRSGLIASDKNAYHRELLKNNPEYREREKQLCKQWYEKNKEKMREYDKQRNKSEQRKEYNREYKRQRYANDVEYRKKTKQRVKQRRLKKKLEQTSLQ